MGQDYFPDIAKSLEINQSACSWTVRALSAVKQRLGVNIKLHDPDNDINQGQIFLFNHFARSETVITHYLIHRESGAYCRSVASALLPTGSTALTPSSPTRTAMSTK